ncbi:MAG: MaoC family dehydratase [Burkholderiales bacterium]
MKVAQGRWFDECAVGETFGSTVTITEAHIMLGAGYVADFNPLHVDEEFARKSRFGGRILHGMLTSAMMGGPVGMHFHGTAIAYLEHNARFLAPVRPGDTLTIAWTITRLAAKPAHGGGIVEMTGTATNQAGVVAAETTGKIMVFARGAPGAPE